MPRTFRNLLASFIAALGLSLPASATTFGTDFTDLWWNPNESGWGVNLIQQYDVIFATLFVYGPDNSNRWFVASDLRGSGSSFSGTLYQTSGPYFGAGGFDPNAVGLTAVGSMTLTFHSDSAGTLSYNVSGTSVSKSIVRQAIRVNNLTGNYLGGMIARNSACASSGNPQGAFLAFDNLTVSHNGTQVTMTVDYLTSGGTAARCTFNSGNYSQIGKMASMSGSFTCSSSGGSNTGTFSMSQIDATRNGFSAVFSGGDNFCGSYSGYFGGTRDVF